MPDYLVPADTIVVRQELKKSRFIASAGRASNKAEAVSFIQSVRRTFPDASHNCWAYIAGEPNNTVAIGMSDDGEPQGTAGKPMLNVLQHKGIGEIVVVVTRYFGGVKLGAGGLVRAYSNAVQAVMEQLPLAEVVAVKEAQLQFPYAHESAIRRLLESLGIIIVETGYQDNVLMHLKIPENQADELEQKAINQTHGEAMLKWLD
jgi:uncharacterized YigZ family protein|tara:strand:- start:1 stop:612 length:612 start_codon:yes stop_codon:yes gene_type:complete